MLRTFGVELVAEGHQVRMQGPQRLEARTLHVPGDLSSAAFLLVRHLIAGEGERVLEGVGVNPSRDGLLRILKRMGADIELRPHPGREGEEPVADLAVRPGSLQSVAVDPTEVALAIDEIPILCIAAACAEGTTRFEGVAELRVKESDRVAAMATGLARLGIEVSMEQDMIAVRGGPMAGGSVDALGDHRIAMSFLVAAAAAAAPITVAGCHGIDTSFPGFMDIMARSGASLEAI